MRLNIGIFIIVIPGNYLNKILYMEYNVKKGIYANMESIKGSIPGNLGFNENIQVYRESNMDVVIEIPVPDKERDRECIEDIKKIMSDELMFQINKGNTLSI